MDNSQSSDVFSGNGNYSFDDQTEFMDTVNYEDLVSNTKFLLSKNIKLEVKKSTFCELFSSALEDSGHCISQSLQLVIVSLSEVEVDLDHLCKILENAVNSLQMLCGFLTRVIEAASMNCSDMKTFPTTTGRIITTVFTHCKDSETIYGHHLKAVERQLKELFRNCHELQLTYLMMMEKHFLFDLTEHQELCILIEALDINLRIGELVQTLDVKTMAEQWKAFTMICEKYADFLINQHLYEDCTKVLCKMIVNNIKTAVENNQEDKIVLRSLKVASFTLKILLRVCNIFKHASNKNYEHIVHSLLFIYMNNSAYLESVQKSPQFLSWIQTNIATPAEALLKELLLDDNFHNCLFKYQAEITAETENLGYVILLTSAMKLVLQSNYNMSIKRRIVDCVFQWLPQGHVWFNMGLKFKSPNSSVTHGLYEHLLTHTFAMASTFDSEEMCYLERKLFESLLGTESYVALFSLNLWELLARLSSPQYLNSQVISLCKVYQTLENEIMFKHCPQQVYLGEILGTLFKYLTTEDKTRVSKLFLISDPSNFGLWSVLGIENSEFLLQSDQHLFENIALELSKGLQTKMRPEEMDGLIQVMRLTASGLFPRDELHVEDFLVKAWSKLCPQNGRFFLRNRSLDQSSLWCIEFITALVALTSAMLHTLRNSSNYVTILHVVSELIENGVPEIKLVLIHLLLKLSLHSYSENVDSSLVKTFQILLQDTDKEVQDKFWDDLREHKENTNIKRIISKILNNETSFREKWNEITEITLELPELKEHLIATKDFQFRHKCIEKKNVIELSDSVSVVGKTSSNNFDLADIDSLFGTDPEPACKRVKLETNEAEDIISRLEKDVSLLRKVKANIVTSDCKVRIRVICEELLNIID